MLNDQEEKALREGQAVFVERAEKEHVPAAYVQIVPIRGRKTGRIVRRLVRLVNTPPGMVVRGGDGV